MQITKRSKVYYPKHISHFGLIDEGDSVEQYDESAFEWFMKAAGKGDEDAQFKLCIVNIVMPEISDFCCKGNLLN